MHVQLPLIKDVTVTNHTLRPFGRPGPLGKYVRSANESMAVGETESRVTTRYYDNDNLRFVEYCLNGVPHRVDGPAWRKWTRDGRLVEQIWSLAGEEHREGGPATVLWYTTGQAKKACYFQRGLRHRLDGPAEIWFDKTGSVVREEWFVEGRAHRVDGPAKFRIENHVHLTEYWLNGKQHRLDGPAEIRFYPETGERQEMWLVDDLLHREDGPAIVTNTIILTTEEYWLILTTEEYWLDGEQRTVEEFQQYRRLRDIGTPHEWAMETL